MPDRPDRRPAASRTLPRALRACAIEASELIRLAYDEYTAEFLRITRRARQRFESRDWKGRYRDSQERLDLYERVLEDVARSLPQILGERATDRALWAGVKRAFAKGLGNRHDVELAETFYNSVTRKILMTVGIDREVEFFRLDPPPKRNVGESLTRRYKYEGNSRALIEAVLSGFTFAVGYENLPRDAGAVARELDLYIWPAVRFGRYNSIDVVATPFYRNKVAYLVGRVNASDAALPLVLPLYNGPGGIYVDTALLEEADVSVVFSFAFSYFHVEVERHDVLIRFLRSILPEKPIADLYTSLGYNKHGKTEFYRNLHHFIHESRERFIIAPGKEGAVMIGFTLPDFDYVFKLIKDRPCFLRSNDTTPKRTSSDEVRRQYDLVCHRDRVGRMVDTQEFENLRFKRKRFSAELLREFNLAARDSVRVEREYVVIDHLYVQRKVVPLPMFLEREQDPEEIRRVVIDFGYFLKDLAATGIFPYDLFNMWNYGVTRRGRVVLFDYDDVQPLEKARFRRKPEARDDNEVLEADEDRIATMPDDFFIDEIERYTGIPQALKATFEHVHGDLFTVEFWSDMQRRIRRGEIVDITPYDRSKRFER